ncbi:MAG: hypothetical protein JO106_09760 [Mycobacterium sp.]|nr:hypothetical protein [Mycobacterium sp.]
MATNDPAMEDVLASHDSRNRQTRRRADITTTIVLLLVHGVLTCGTALALSSA